MVRKKTLQMYWGYNGAHEFWQDEAVGVLVDKRDGIWKNLDGKIQGNLPEVITALEKSLGIVLKLNTKKIWSEPRDEDERMVLREVG